MTTGTVWLLIGFGHWGAHSSNPTSVIERFESVAECSRVAELITKSGNSAQKVQCIQAKVVK